MRRNQVISKRKLISNIVGWPDYYISKRSRLYRYYPKRKVWMLLKGTLNRGRIYHILRDSNKHKRIQASRLVALAWVPNPESKPHVCHKDNNPCNNIHTNLYWGTQKENVYQSIRDGNNRISVMGKDNIHRKLNLNDIPKVKAYYNTLLSELIQLGFTKWKVNKTLLRVLGKRFGVGDRVIRNILNNSYENKESRGSKR